MTDKRDSAGVIASDRAVYAACWMTTLLALALSYRNLLDFASQRGALPLWAAVAWPLLLDVFLVVGELRLFSATARREKLRIKIWAAVLTAVGLAASLAGNIAHAGLGAPWQVKLAAAVPPLAAAASLGTGLGIVKLKARPAKTGEEPRAAAADSSQPRAPAKTSRARPSVPVEQIEAWYTAELAAGLPVGKQAFAARHKADGLTEHQARVFLKARGNGHELLVSR
jgi:hypothetical protein